MGDTRNSFKILVGKYEGKRPLGRPRFRWEDNMRPDLVEIEREFVDFMCLAQWLRNQWRAFVNTLMNSRVP